MMGIFGGSISSEIVEAYGQGKQKLTWQLFVWLGVLISLYMFINLGKPEQSVETVVGLFIVILVILMNFFFGYFALGAATLIILVDSVLQFNIWLTTGDFFRISAISMNILTLCASAIIAYTSEKGNRKKRALEQLSITDPVTKVYNHRYFEERLEKELTRAVNNNETLVLCMLDIDQFKMFNDLRGHAEGDKALALTASLLKGVLRKGDILCRYGEMSL